MADVELEDCTLGCPAKAGGDHDHTPEPFVPGWMPWSAYGWPTGLPDHPVNARYEPVRFVETWEEDAEGWVTTPLDYMRQGDCE